MKKLITPKVFLVLLFLLAGTIVKAQVNVITNFTPQPIKAYCAGDAVKLTAASSADAASYVWTRYPGAGTAGAPTILTTQTGADMVDTPPAKGYYTYVSTAVNAEHCESVVSNPVIVYMLPGIDLAISSSAPTTTKYCTNAVPTTLTLSVVATKAQTVTETFGYNYQWYKGTSQISGATGASYTLTAADDAAVGTGIAYSVKVSYKVAGCETTSSEIKFDVLALPTKPTVTITTP